MKQPLFGTDGIRGKANRFPIDPASMVKLAMALGKVFRNGTHRHRVIIGKDTRLSGYMLENAMTAGLVAMGFDVILVGPLPTPAVSMLIKSFRTDLGVMISASHNSYEDNGIKVFGPSRQKISDEQQRLVEESFYLEDFSPVSPELIGKARRYLDAPGRYIEFLKNTLPADLTFDSMKIVIDCAHGAGYRIAPAVFSELGATVIPVGIEPNGTNINLDCGATNTLMVAKRVLEEQADIGLALDGDADRLQVVDHYGRTINGEQIIALMAKYWKSLGKLSHHTVVSTIAANINLESYLASLDIQLCRTPIGDRFISFEMQKHGFNFGGEPSGHILMGDYSGTGDGILTSLQLLACLKNEGKPIGDICPLFEMIPQKNLNFPVLNTNPLENPQTREQIAHLSSDIENNHSGRLIVRRSGTEPVIRVTIEIQNSTTADHFAHKISKILQQSPPA